MKSRVQGMLVLAGVVLSAAVAFPGEQDPARETTSAVTVEQVAPGPDAPRRYEPQGVIVYDNGPLTTHPGGGFGGADASALQTALGMTVFGFTNSVSGNFRLADDFVVPVGTTMRVDTATFFAYQTGSTTTSTMNHVDVQIWNGPPDNPASTVIFGDMTTNRMVSTTFSNIYRVLDTGLTVNNRPIMASTATIGMTLAAGTYWIDWRTGGTLASGPFAPPITILGQTTTGNAKQRSAAGAWVNLTDIGPQGMPFVLRSAEVAVPAALAVDASGNGVLQPNEPAVIVAPSWRNPETVSIPNVTGVLSNFTGPAGPTYTINDNAAAYGTIAAGATASCGSNCYAVTITSATRPILHWDSTALETVTPGGVTKDWTLHVGDSFTDVPASNGFYRFIETILHKGITGGCTATAYCPQNSTTREQMAVFVLIAKEGAGYSPVACGATPMFTDVPASSPFCRFIEELARRGVVGGCSPGLYCPSAPVTREQMAIFALRTLDPTLNPPACGTPVFNDVPASSPFCRWIEELVRRGVVSGCGNNNYCPTNPVTREQMGVFLAATFSLTLYGL